MDFPGIIMRGGYGLAAAAALVLAARAFLRGLAVYSTRASLASQADSAPDRLLAGPVSVSGAAVPVLPLLDPIYNKPCVYYRVDVTEARVASARPGSLAGRLFNGDLRSFFSGDKYSLYHADSGGAPFLLAANQAQTAVSAGAVAYLGAPTLEVYEKSPGESAWYGDAAAGQFLAGIPRRRGAHLRAVIIREGDALRAWGCASSSSGRQTYAEQLAAERCLQRPALERLVRCARATHAALDTDGDGDLEGSELDAAVEAKKAEVEAGLADWRGQLETRFKVLVREGVTGKLQLAPAGAGAWLNPLTAPVALRLFGGPVVFCLALLLLLGGPGIFTAFVKKPPPPPAAAAVQDQAGGALAAAARLGAGGVPTASDRMQITNLGGEAARERKGCDAGDLKQCLRLGARYYDGRGVAKDVSTAMPLLQRACIGGEPSACTLAGFIRLNGTDGLSPDPAAGAALLRNACDSGDAFGCGLLGSVYADGLDGKPDHALAAKYYQRACDGNVPVGCSALGRLYSLGLGVPRDLDKAEALLSKACDSKDPLGCQLLQQAGRLKQEMARQPGK